MQDYPETLLFARAYGDCHDPASPFFGTYTTGFPLSPLVLPLLLLRGIGAFVGLENAGRVMWTLYAVGLPLASMHLLDVLGRDRWQVLLVLPLLLSYWVIGGFFAFATAMPFLVLGLALSVRWLLAPSWRGGVLLSGVLCILDLWHALAFAQLVLDFGVLWLVFPAGLSRDRFRALIPLVPSLTLFVAWMWTTIVTRAPGSIPPKWLSFPDAAPHFVDFIGPSVSEGAAAVLLIAVVIVAGRFFGSHRPSPGRLRVSDPFALLALLAAASFLLLPRDCFGVEGISNRQPWIAALFLAFSARLPSRRGLRESLLVVAAGLGTVILVANCRRFVAFARESAGASRLIDRLGEGDTLFAPTRGTAASFPGKPLIGLDLYASIRHGGLPNQSFAGYSCNLVRYIDKNPMPGLHGRWIGDPALTRFDYVLVRSTDSAAAERPDVLVPVGTDDGWLLYGVCGSRSRPKGCAAPDPGGRGR
jgi:hypothetical protein